MRTIHDACIHDSALLNPTNAMLLELLIQLTKELVHNPQAGKFSPKATDGAVVGSGNSHVQEEKFAEKKGVVDAFFYLVITQAVPDLQQEDLEHHQGIVSWIACGVLGLGVFLVEQSPKPSPVNARIDAAKEEVFHAVTACLGVHLNEARSWGGGLGGHSLISMIYIHKDTNNQRYM